MDDKNIMENILLLEKGMCDLFMHGTVESPTKGVHTAFCNALNDSLCAQDTVYTKMSEKGWYAPEAAEQNKIASLRQKFSSNN